MSAMLTRQKRDGKWCISKSLIPSLAIQRTNQGSTKLNPELLRGRSLRTQRSRSLLLLSLLFIVLFHPELRDNFRLRQCVSSRPFILFQSREAQKQCTELVSPAERPVTCGKTVPTPGPSHSTNNQRFNGLDMGNSTDFPKIDIEDEYPIYNFEYDKNRFTHDFFEYEQGQKEIIVKHRLRDHIDFWKSINANDFIIDTIFNGYKILFCSLPPVSFSKNNKSALLESKFVSEAIRDLLDRGLVTESEHTPKVINPLSVSIQNNGKRRLILDLRLVNMHIWKQSVKYDDIRYCFIIFKARFVDD